MIVKTKSICVWKETENKPKLCKFEELVRLIENEHKITKIKFI